MNKRLVLLKVRILRKTFILMSALLFIFGIKNDAYCLSSEFAQMLKIIGVPQYNVYNQQINEDVYKVYNLFVYSSPTSVNASGQRWKTLSAGKWKYKGGMYKGSGTRGEYLILGRDYSGAIVYNYYFPADRLPTVSPEHWNYLYVDGAASSWKNKNKYVYVEQLEYMKNANWYFSDISKGVNNPYNQIEYNINALKVGLSKARLETSATWKSSGTVYIRRRSETGKIGYAIFMIPPMGEDVTLKAQIISSSDKYVLTQDSDEIYIPIKVDAYLENLNKYTKKEHVKNFNLRLYINSKEVLKNSGSKITSLGNEYMLVLTRQDFPPTQKHTIEIKLDAIVQTAFSNDGLLKTSQSKNISLIVEEKKIEVITSSDIGELVLTNNKWVVSPLAQNFETKIKNSEGFTESGRHIVIKSSLNNFQGVEKENILDIQIYLNDLKIDKYEILNSDEDIMALRLKIPYNLPNTLYGYKSLRDKELNYFCVSAEEVGKRMQEPYKLKMVYKYKNELYENSMLLDVLDDYINNMNLCVSNSYKDKERLDLDKWLEI